MSINAHTCIRPEVCICPFVMLFQKFLYVKHCWSNKGMKMRHALNQNLHIVKRSMKAIIFRVFNEKLLFINTCLIFSYQK